VEPPQDDDRKRGHRGRPGRAAREGVPWHEALAGYEQSRNATALSDYRENLAAARLEPPPAAVMELRRQLRDDPIATRQFLLAREGIEQQLTTPAR
jgi:hypothetical protein